MELTTPGLEGKWLNHYTTEASTTRQTRQNKCDDIDIKIIISKV